MKYINLSDWFWSCLAVFPKSDLKLLNLICFFFFKVNEALVSFVCANLDSIVAQVLKIIFSIMLMKGEGEEGPVDQKQPPEVFYKKGVLKSFPKFTGKHKHLYQKICDICFSVNFAKFLRIPFFTENFWTTTSAEYELSWWKGRSSRPVVFCKKGVLKNFIKFTGKHVSESLTKRLWHRCFPVNFVKFLRTPFLWWLLLKKMTMFSKTNFSTHDSAYWQLLRTLTL